MTREDAAERYPDIAPTLIVDRSIGRRHTFEFDMARYVDFLRGHGMSDERICGLTVEFGKPNAEDTVRGELLPEGEVYFGMYRPANQSAHVFWQYNRTKEDRPAEFVDDLDLDRHRTLVHESGHFIDDMSGRGHRMQRRWTVLCESASALVGLSLYLMQKSIISGIAGEKHPIPRGKLLLGAWSVLLGRIVVGQIHESAWAQNNSDLTISEQRALRIEKEYLTMPPFARIARRAT